MGKLCMSIGNGDASSGGCLLVKTPEEARELIENIADASQHFRTRATASSSKGVFGVTPNESPDLAKAMGDIASVLKDIREGQQNLLNEDHTIAATHNFYD
ncbi:hypothetical protein PIB30_065640 [Stylosanthes scabra]|uniref:Uncharacterized protein n=1 Tax=Stylosanthes scabra TaxID=79078 RepID=A0ABU6QM00_9FABA|nr:hypothetical protein [Stylosanthes scabra]